LVGSFVSENLFDNNASTYHGDRYTPKTSGHVWSSGSGFECAEIAISARNDGYHGQSPKAFDVQYSTDGSTWHTVISYSSQTGWTSGETRTFEVPGASPASGASSGAGTALAQTVRVLAADPTSDVDNAGWVPSTGVDLWAMVDNPPDTDGSFIFTHTAGAACEIALGYAPVPGDLEGYEAQFQIVGDGTSGITIKLMQGASVIRTWTYDPAPSDWTTVITPLSAGEVASITDPTQLRYELTEV
jgi:hypothetical protein